MYDNDETDRTENPEGPEAGFRALRNRPADEVDGEALWHRIEGDLEPRSARAGWFGRIAALAGLNDAPALPQLAAVGAVVVLMLGVVWWAPAILGPSTPMPATVESSPVGAPAWQLEVRLVRGFDGAAPADAIPSAGAGAGGADVLRDLRGSLGDLMPFEDFALVGQWQGGMQSDQVTASLSDSFELSFASTPTADGVALTDVQLAGAGRPLVAEQLALTPGQPYLFSVLAPGETDAAGSLVLAVRLVPVTDSQQ